jgi:sugar lactone lactonase YvrE
MLTPFIESMIAAAESTGILDRNPFALTPDPENSTARLRYPGKVAIDGSRIAISDSGNNRVIVGSLSADGKSMATVKEIGGDRGFRDGDGPLFDAPQGLCFRGDVLYVADAGNHSIRAIDLKSWNVSTIAGNGRQLRTHADREQRALSSPWDVAIRDETLYIAMAGVHQVWSMNLSSGALRVHAGTGGEDIRDGRGAEALLAQPMGITSGEKTLYVADAESSAIRECDSDDEGNVRTLIGTGLFDFGDVDGVGDTVRMQHQQGVAVAPDGRLLVADSYNDSLKWVDPVSRSTTTWIKGLHEPGGVACGEARAYVADTNAHRIVTVAYGDGDVSELNLQ